jgi:hypothetical protein
MFGFARLAAYDYFDHVKTALAQRFRARGHATEIRVVEVHPTASIRRRAAKLAQMLAHTSSATRRAASTRVWWCRRPCT